MIAFAASRKRPGTAFATSPPSTPSKRSAGSGPPVTPVEARKTSAGLQPDACAASFAVNAVAARPLFPVNALALPELTTSARAFPAFSFSRHHSTGAEGHFERVKTPATVVPLSNKASSTSVRPLYLMPAAPVARRMPATSGISGNFLGAKGETVEDIARLLCVGYENARRGGRASTKHYTAMRCRSILLLLGSRRRSRSRRGSGSRSRRRRGGGRGRFTDALDLAFGAQLGDQFCLRAAHQIALELILDLVELRRLALALVLDLDDVPAELRLHRIRKLTLVELEGDF